LILAVVTRSIYQALPEVAEYEIGVANIFIQHTSASLTISENASPDVPLDMEVSDTLADGTSSRVWFQRGAFLKSSRLGCSCLDLSVPTKVHLTTDNKPWKWVLASAPPSAGRPGQTGTRERPVPAY